MKKVKSTILALTMGAIAFGAISTSANELKEKNVMVQIHKLHENDSKIDIQINDTVEAFRLPELAVGDVEDIITESGNSLAVARTESGYTVTIDGEEVNLPMVGSEMSANILKEVMPLHTNTENNIQVIGDLTDEQVAIVKDGFAAAGVDKEIVFSKGHDVRFITIGDHDSNYNIDLTGDSNLKTWISDDGSEHHVKVIKMGDKMKNMKFKSEIIVIDKSDDEEQ
ncbi:MAG: hypothetical protein KUG78_08100 [Kangiellaceae bacterium]|nr:hypothetical protein [Kangiellaceae bacterium]